MDGRPTLVHEPSEAFTDRVGVVAAFDDHVGAGTLTDAETGEAWWFHCTRIAGGERSIAVGTPVAYRAVPGPTGLEAVDVAATGPAT